MVCFSPTFSFFFYVVSKRGGHATAASTPIVFAVSPPPPWYFFSSLSLLDLIYFYGFSLSFALSNSTFTDFVTFYLRVCVGLLFWWSVGCDFCPSVFVPFLVLSKVTSLRLYLLEELVVKFWSIFIWLVNSAGKLQWVWVCDSVVEIIF